MKPPALWLLAALGLLVFAGLSFAGRRVHSRAMGNTMAKTTPAALRARRAAQARRRRAEDKADYARIVKRLADIEAGRSKVYSREEAWRVLGL